MRSAWGWVLCVVAALAWGEWVNWRWSRMLVGNRRGASEAVVVPGYRNPRPTINIINRWRVRAGLRSITSYGSRETRVIFSGGTAGGGPAEALLMADYAKTVLEFDDRVLIEDQSRTTWENVTNVIPLLSGVDRIVIASQPAHALKVRAYLHRQRPDFTERLVRGQDYRPGEWILVKPLLALHGLWTLRGLRAHERQIWL